MPIINGMGRWGVKAKSSVIIPGNDTDAQAFITAAGITNSTQQSAINTLVTSLKGYGIWSKMKAIYPMVGGTATAHKFNLKNPVDSNAAYRLSFVGGWTHSSTGALPNGTNAYANTQLPFNTMSINSQHLSYYSRTNSLNQTRFEMGCSDGGSLASAIVLSWPSLGNLSRISQPFSALYVPTKTDAYGIINSNTSNNSRFFENGVYKGQNTGTQTTLGNRYYYIGAVNGTATNVNNGTPTWYTTRECAFATIGDGLTDTEAANLYTAVQAFQTTLGRQVDADASAFITAAGITDTTQVSAINTLVTNLKSYGLWDKMKAIYPMVGGTAAAHKFNLKNPADSNAAFRLGFYGGMTHDSNGVSFGGSNGGASTYFNPFLNQTKNDLHLSVYARIRTAGRFSLSNDISPNRSYVVAGWTSLRATSTTANTSEFFGTSDSGEGTAGLNGTSVGFSLGSRTSSTAIKYYKNTTSASGNGTSHTADFVNAELTLNGNPGGGYYSVANYAFVSLGNGLTDAEAANFYTVVQAYQTTLGRQV